MMEVPVDYRAIAALSSSGLCADGHGQSAVQDTALKR
jgi:hypothetical protein